MTTTEAQPTDWRAMHDAARANIQAWLDRNGVTFTSTFVPYSKVDKSRWTTKDHKCVTWDVHLHVNDRNVMTFRYSAGVTHLKCWKGFKGFQRTIAEQAEVDHEIEHGKPLQAWRYGSRTIEPDYINALQCVLYDYSVLDFPTYEQWAPDSGFDPDSRFGERVYRECIEQSLKLRNALGDPKVCELSELYNDF
jgi:hypothetical protein